MKRFSLFFLFLSASRVLACLQGPDASLIQQTLNEGKNAALCPNSVFAVTDPIVFPKDDLAIYTEGYPTDSTRALLRITGEKLVGANRLITALNAIGKSRIKIQNIQIDGGREESDRRPYLINSGVPGLIEFGGGNSVDSEISHIRAYNTRGWTTVHVIEGAKRTRISKNHLGPAGHLASEVWADGISVAAEESEIIGNVIEDATDGGIVVFGAPRSKIIGNTIRSKTRPVLGGINMVDYTPWNGSFEGTIVSRNSIVAQSDQVRIGIAMGPPIWNCDGDLWWASLRLRGATVTDNLFTGNRMGYGIAVDNVDNWTMRGNISHARHSGTPQNRCKGINEKPSTAPFIQMHTLSPQFDGFFIVRFAGMRSLHNLADTGPRSFRNDSELVSQNTPDTMEIGKTYPIQIKFRNTGTQTWNPASGYRIGMLNPQDNNTWGLGRVELPSPVLPNETVTLEFNVTAPSAPGQYHLQCGTLQEGVEWFGDVSNNVVIDVVTPPPPLDPKPEIKDLLPLTPTPIVGNSVELKVDAIHIDGDASDLIYTWSNAVNNPSTATFSHNNSTSAYQTTATFNQPGNYTFIVTVRNSDDKIASQQLTVPVVSKLKTLIITPVDPQVLTDGMIQFEAQSLNQFQHPIPADIQWSTEDGLIDTEGKYTAPSSTKTVQIRASAEGLISTTTVRVISSSLGISAPPRQTRIANFYPVLTLEKITPLQSVLTVWPSEEGFKIRSYDWVFYPLTRNALRLLSQDDMPARLTGILRISTTEGRIDLSTLDLKRDQTYKIIVMAWTKDNKQSKSTSQMTRFINESDMRPPAPPIIRTEK